MAYTALYRKWRPTRFEDVRGQEPIVKTLQNQMNSGRVGHAYLFCGTRGTGKTTMAKIFARAVNCEHPVNGSPCNECPTCRAILSGTSVNVVEIDAASNNGVDNIREIREEVKYKPTEGKYRVYIIDEVHMLSAGAFNALLKTLEEPPEYVIFILATTEVHKIPITVLSRCQRYDFKRLSYGALQDQVRDLLTAEGVPFEEGAVKYIARAADGSSRDALSLLEQCVSFFYNETLTYEKVLDVLGAVDQTVFSRMLRCILEVDIRGAVGLIDELMASGRELGQFVTDFTWYLRNILLIQTEDPGEEVLGISRENLERMREEAGHMEVNRVMRYIRILSELSNRMRYAASKRVLLELDIMKMMQPAAEEDLSSLIDRVRALEERGVPAAGNTPRAADTAAEKSTVIRKPAVEVQVGEAEYADYQQLSKDWEAITESAGALLRSILIGTAVTVEDGGITVLFRQEFNYRIAQNANREKDVEALLKERYQKEFRVKFRLLKQDEEAPKVVLGHRIPGINMEIED